MENRESMNDIFNKLQESGKHFEAKVPDHLFGRIESRLETVKKPRKIDFQSLAAYAAISLSIAVSILILGLHLKDRSKSLPIEEHYVVQMLDMEDNKSAYPSYDIHKLMSAYETILAGETILKDSSSGLDISVNN